MDFHFPLPAPQFDSVFKNAKNIKNFNKSNGDIIIGHDVWIGGRTTILSGVKIGTGAVIAAGSVVVNDVEAYSISGGNPNKEIRKRFNEDIIKKLLNSEWWNLADNDIDNLSEHLLSNNFELFFNNIEEIKNRQN